MKQAKWISKKQTDILIIILFLKYSEEDVWRPENNNSNTQKSRYEFIDYNSIVDLSHKTKLYDWVLNDQNVNEIYGFIHPCKTSFTCLRMNGRGLSPEEKQINKIAMHNIINLYYYDKQISRGDILYNFFINNPDKITDSPFLVLDEYYNIVLKGNDIDSELSGFKISINDVMELIIYSTTNRPSIFSNFDDYTIGEYKLKNDILKINLKTVRNIKTVYYFCKLIILKKDNFYFTKREKEILKLIAQGEKNKEIAEELFIDESTVKKHIYNMMQKSNVRNRIELLRFFQTK